MTITLATKISDLSWNEDALSLNHLADETLLDTDPTGDVWSGMADDATVGDYIDELADNAGDDA